MNDTLFGQGAKQISLADMEPVIRELLASGGAFVMTITGTSMTPTLIDHRDRVTLKQADLPLRRGDLPLYRRDNGQYVLHRVIGVQADGSYTCCGDHQWVPEPGIRDNQIIGCTAEITRKGKSFSVKKPGYRLWVSFWLSCLKWRKLLLRFYYFFRRKK